MGFTYNQLGVIQNDQEAEDLILQMKKHEAERARLRAVCEAQIKKYQERISEIEAEFDSEAEYPYIMLGNYAKARANKITKTKASYALPSGTLAWKKQNPEYKRDEKSMLEWVKEHAKRFVKVTEVWKTDWEAMKKQLIYDEDGSLLGAPADDGEILPVPGLEVIERPDVFSIE